VTFDITVPQPDFNVPGLEFAGRRHRVLEIPERKRILRALVLRRSVSLFIVRFIAEPHAASLGLGPAANCSV